MSRSYAQFRDRFWIGATGREIGRKLGSDGLLIAAHSFTCPASNMWGLYHSAVPTIAHETRIPIDRVEAAMKGLSEGLDSPFLVYDEGHEEVFVVNMAAEQVAEIIDPSDNRARRLIADLPSLRRMTLYPLWEERYNLAFSLDTLAEVVAKTAAGKKAARKGLRRNTQAPRPTLTKPGTGTGTGTGTDSSSSSRAPVRAAASSEASEPQQLPADAGVSLDSKPNGNGTCSAEAYSLADWFRAQRLTVNPRATTHDLGKLANNLVWKLARGQEALAAQALLERLTSDEIRDTVGWAMRQVARTPGRLPWGTILKSLRDVGPKWETIQLAKIASENDPQALADEARRREELALYGPDA